MSATVATTGPGASVAQGRPSDPVAFIAQLALDERIDGAKLQILWDLQKDILAEQRKEHAEKSRVAFYAALAEVQRQLPLIRRDKENPNTHSRFAQFSTIWGQCLPIWTKYGFAVSFDSKTLENNLIEVSLRLSHKDGHHEIFHAPAAPPDTSGLRGVANKTFVQGNQSTITYLQRGLLCRALGIVTADFDDEDDDGAGGAAPTTVVQRRGRDMPPVGRADPIVSYPQYPESHDSAVPDSPPQGSMRQAAQEVERQKRTIWREKLRVALDSAETEAEVAAILSRESVKDARNNWPLAERQEIEADITRTYSRLGKVFDHETEEQLSERLSEPDGDEP